MPRKTDAAQTPVTPAAEQHLVDSIDSLSGNRVLCMSLAAGLFAREYLRHHPEARMVCWFVDRADAAAAEAAVADEGDDITGRLQLVCSADLPDGEFDLCVFPVPGGRHAEFYREILRQGHGVLRAGGALAVAHEARDDRWLHAELQQLFPKVTRQVSRRRILYRGTKAGPLKKQKDYRCELVFRDGDDLRRVTTRPGMDGHRMILPAERALLDLLPVPEDGQRYLQIGCASGAAAIGLAGRNPNCVYHVIDTNCRAIDCLNEAIERNGVTNITVEQTTCTDFHSDQPFDFVLSMPPETQGNRVGLAHLRLARRVLKPEGQIVVVTKLMNQFGEAMVRWFNDVAVDEVRNLFVLSALQRPPNTRSRGDEMLDLIDMDDL